MTHIILDCKKDTCIHYYGQCQFERMARIKEDEIYCEDFVDCYSADSNEYEKKMELYHDINNCE